MYLDVLPEAWIAPPQVRQLRFGVFRGTQPRRLPPAGYHRRPAHDQAKQQHVPDRIGQVSRCRGGIAGGQAKDSAEAKAALSRKGRYKRVAGTLQVKEVRLPGADDRFIICYNPDQAVRDAAVRAKMISALEEMIAGSDALTMVRRAELRGRISTMPGLNRFLRTMPGGLLRTDRARAKAEENLDGKYLLRSADPAMTAQDIAAGYKQLLEVERGWRDMKSVLDLRPVCHRLEERIRAHVILCWLALLLIRVAENHSGQTWPAMRRELQRISLGTFTGPAGTFRQRTDIPRTARDLLTALNIDVPRKIHELTTPAA